MVEAGPRRRIRKLDAGVIAGIAAGEVVERPASVVKELVENALDAGARRIRVELDDRDAISLVVTDDGSGIEPEDIELAVTQHATSKIERLADVDDVVTFGFRGEALASIAAVADVEITTAVEGAVEALRVRVDAGRIVERGAAAGARGTRVAVADLFARVPARRKFLKSAATEAGLVADVVRRFALLEPAVHFRLTRNGRAVLDAPGVADAATRVRQVLGGDTAARLVAVDAHLGDLHVHGHISRAGESYGSAARVMLFVGGRWVRDRLLYRSVMEGYRTFLLKGRYPVCVLHLDCGPGAVDVNVHPSKLEVRFRDPEQVRRVVAESVAEALRRHGDVVGRWTAAGAEARSLRKREEALRQGPPAPMTDHAGSAAAPARRDPQPEPSPLPHAATLSGDVEDADVERGATGRAGADALAESLPGYRPSPVTAAAPAPPEQVALGLEAGAEGTLGRLEVLGQAFSGYIVCEGDGELVLVDQHAAHERMLFEALMASWEARAVAVQPLLLPVTVGVGAAGVDAVERHVDELEAMGWDIGAFGEEDVVVRATPALAADAGIEALAEALVADLVELGTAASAARLVERVLATVACHSAVRIGKRLDRGAAAALLRSVADVDFHAACPHGRPVARALGRGQIERMFGRSAT